MRYGFGRVCSVLAAERTSASMRASCVDQIVDLSDGSITELWDEFCYIKDG